MIKITLKRLLQLIFVLVIISSIVFFLQRMIPGNPADMILGADARQEDKQAWLLKYGFLDPLWTQYLQFLKNLMHFDLGHSFASYEKVSQIILPRLIETAKLAIVSFLLSLFLTVVLGITGAAFQGRPTDKGLAIMSLVFVSAPTFILGPILLWILSVHWDFFPLMGSDSPASYVLPCITLALPLSAYTGRMLRSGIVDVLREDYIRTAKSKGLSYTEVLKNHALKNAFLPTLTLLGLQLGVLLSGTIITEQIFNWPGMGSLLIESVSAREYNIVSGCVICIAAIYVISNLLVDLLSCALDPRLRVS